MALASVSTVTVLIFLFGCSLLFFMNFQRLRGTLASEIEMHAYLKANVTPEEGESLAHRITSTSHIVSVAYISKEEALSRLKADLNRDIELSGIINNPLPAYLSIKVDDPEKIPLVAENIEKMPEVDQVNYLQKIIHQFISLLNGIQKLLLGLVVFLLACALLIIHNTIRLGFFSRKKEIEIMKLVGASHGFISWPFVLEGAFYGLMGGALAVLLLEPGYHAIVNKVTQLFPIWPVVNGAEVWKLLAGLLATGVLVGGSGSYFSINRYLHY